MDEAVIAFSGTVELLDARWSLSDGRMVDLRLCGEAFHRVHPFKKFQQRRAGKMGTRFQAAFSLVESTQNVLTMEMMLAGWKDSSAVGQTITLWLDDEADVHPFCGCERRKNGTPGQMFALVLVELNDDETPVDQVRREHIEGGDPLSLHDGGQSSSPTHSTTAKSGTAQRRGAANNHGAEPSHSGTHRAPQKLSSSVHLMVTKPLYIRWLQETKGSLVKEWTPELARQYTKKVIHVESLSDLDRDKEAVKRFHENIRRPFERWAHQEP